APRRTGGDAGRHASVAHHCGWDEVDGAGFAGTTVAAQRIALAAAVGEAGVARARSALLIRRALARAGIADVEGFVAEPATGTRRVAGSQRSALLAEAAEAGATVSVDLTLHAGVVGLAHAVGAVGVLETLHTGAVEADVVAGAVGVLEALDTGVL